MSKSVYVAAAICVAAAIALPPLIGRHLRRELTRLHGELTRDRHRERLRALADADLEAKLRR